MKKVRDLFGFLLIALVVTSCSVCKPGKASKALADNLPFKKTHIKLVSDDSKNCTYLFEVTSKSTKKPTYFQVTREHGEWIHQIVTK